MATRSKHARRRCRPLALLLLPLLLLLCCSEETNPPVADSQAGLDGPRAELGPTPDGPAKADGPIVGDADPGADKGTPPPAAYQGFGAVTKGAASSPSGSAVYHVTSLADSGAGTLRDGLSAGKRRIVFDVGGAITLKSTLEVRYPYITIDGATAPSPGITIIQPGTIGTVIEAHNSSGPVHDVIITHLRMDGQASTHANAGDIWGLDGEKKAVHRVIIDHVTGIASTDGVFDIWGEVHDVTISWSLILDTVTALHLSTGDLSKKRQRISFHHNVLARNNERQIRVRHDNQLIDYVNNVVYGWGWMEAGGAGLHIAYDSGEVNPSLNVINNVFFFVSGLKGKADDAIKFERGTSEGKVFFSGNVVPTGEQDATSSASAKLPIPPAAQVTTWLAKDLWSKLVPKVGTHYPTAKETQLLQTVANAVK
jgi:pectate lyase